VYSSTLPSTLALDAGGWSTPRPDRFTSGKGPVPIVRRPQGQYGRVRKISPTPGFHPRTVQPVASSYTDCAIRPLNGITCLHFICNRNEKKLVSALFLHIQTHNQVTKPIHISAKQHSGSHFPSCFYPKRQACQTTPSVYLGTPVTTTCMDRNIVTNCKLTLWP